MLFVMGSFQIISEKKKQYLLKTFSVYLSLKILRYCGNVDGDIRF